jgi:hypothetical protein
MSCLMDVIKLVYVATVLVLEALISTSLSGIRVHLWLSKQDSTQRTQCPRMLVGKR